MSLWDNPVFKSAYNSLSMEDKARYHKIGDQMYNTDRDYRDPKVTEFNYAQQIKIMLRDGLRVDDLTMDEKRIYIEVFGIESLDEYLREEKKRINQSESDCTKQKKTKRMARMVGGKRV